MVLAQRAWQAMGGVVTLAFVAHFLSPTEQGYFYTLASIAALHMVLDMGLSAVLVQLAAKEFVGLTWGLRGVAEGVSLPRFLALARLSLLWYGAAAVIFLLAYPLGIVFMAGGQGNLTYDWRAPWAMMVFATAASFPFLPVLALVEGSGGIAEVYAVRLLQGVIGAMVVWGAFAVGGGLYGLAMQPMASTLVAAVWLYLRRRGMIVQAFQQKIGRFRWGAEVWPLQWRVGVSWLAGYMLVLMHVPLMFRTQGPIVAGQMGVTMTVANMLSLLALSWITARIPSMAEAASKRDWAQLDHIYWNPFVASCLTFLAGSAMFLLIRVALDKTPYGARFLPVVQCAGLLVAMGFYHLSGLLAAYLRVHLKEPFAWLSLLGALLTAFGAIWAAPQWGAAGVVAVLIVVNVLFFFPVTLFLWFELRRKWHFGSA